MRLAALALGVVALLIAGVVRAAPAAAGGGYQPPVAAPVSDPFRPPSQTYGPGNRGLDYATAPGTEIKAAADGEVVFAGQVGGTLHVVVLHADGIRTSYSFLSSVRVKRGDTVRRGKVVGTTGAQPFHFGARAGDAYLDPAALFSTGPPQVHLVPDSERRPQSEPRERSGLLGTLAGLPGRAAGVASEALGATSDAVDWAAGRGVDAAGWVAGKTFDAAGASLSLLGRQAAGSINELRAMWAACVNQFPPVQAFHFVSAVAGLFDQGACTPSDVPAPRLHDRHMVVLVGGLGSRGSATGGGAAIFAVDTAALGYAPDDVVRFSYRGGTAADHPYEKDDTEVDIRTSGARLRALLEQLQYDHPGVTVDVLAHSQGGLVTRAAVAEGYDRSDPRLPQIGAIVTMGSPHHGTDGATAVASMRRHPGADVLFAGVHEALPAFDDPRATSIAQMSERSSFIEKLNERRIPEGVWFTSIGAREDWLVPATHTRVAGAHNVVVSVPSPTAHDALPSSSAARRETALALNHMAPTCKSLLTTLTDTVVAEGVHRAERGVAGVATGSGGLP
jgi:hypothetical protein